MNASGSCVGRGARGARSKSTVIILKGCNVNNRIRFEEPLRSRPVPVEPVFPPDYEPGEYDPEDE